MAPDIQNTVHNLDRLEVIDGASKSLAALMMFCIEHRIEVKGLKSLIPSGHSLAYGEILIKTGFLKKKLERQFVTLSSFHLRDGNKVNILNRVSIASISDDIANMNFVTLALEHELNQPYTGLPHSVSLLSERATGDKWPRREFSDFEQCTVNVFEKLIASLKLEETWNKFLQFNPALTKERTPLKEKNLYKSPPVFENYRGLKLQNFDRDYIKNYSWSRPEQTILRDLPPNYFWPDEFGPLEDWTEDISTDLLEHNYGWQKTKSKLLLLGRNYNIWIGDSFVIGDCNFGLLRFGEKKPFFVALVNFIPNLEKLYIYEIKTVSGNNDLIKTETYLQISLPINQVSNLEQLCLNMKNLGEFMGNKLPPNWVKYIRTNYPLHWDDT